MSHLMNTIKQYLVLFCIFALKIAACFRALAFIGTN